MIGWLRRLLGRRDSPEAEALTVVERLYRRYLPSIRGVELEQNLQRHREAIREDMRGLPSDRAEMERMAGDARAQRQREIERVNAENELLQCPAPMSLDDFARIIPPILMRYPQFPAGFTDEGAALLHAYAGAKTHAEQMNARDHLAWMYHEVILSAARTLRSNHEKLTAAASVGRSVVIQVPEHCCLAMFDGKIAQARELLDAYLEPDSELPVLPPPETPCLLRDGVWQVCEIWLRPEFVRSETTVPCNWRDALNAQRASMLKAELLAARSELESLVEKIRAASNAMGSQPDEKCLCQLGIRGLRDMQRRHGLRGHRKMADIATQLLAHRPAENEIEAISIAWRKQELVRAKQDARRCVEHIGWLERQIANIEQA